jgi:hypothetical protein
VRLRSGESRSGPPLDFKATDQLPIKTPFAANVIDDPGISTLVILTTIAIFIEFYLFSIVSGILTLQFRYPILRWN